MLARASQLLPLARAGREVSMARPSSPRTTQPLCIALVAVAPRGSSSGRRPDLADTPFTLPRLSLALSLSHGRSSPSPPFALATVSDHPSLPRPAQELRLSLFLPTATRVPGSPASPPRRRSPLRAPTIVAVEFVVSSASPSPLTIPAAPR